jgi:hypothetical protein
VRSGTESDVLAEVINYIFHHTTLNNAVIAAQILVDYNLYITARQVKRIRLKAGWLRASSGAKKQQSEPRLSNKWKMQSPTAQREYLVDAGLLPGYAFIALKHIKSTSLLHSILSILTELPLACQDYEKHGSRTT